MNETIHTLLEHRSVRKFKNKKINDDDFTAIINAAQAASTSSYIQAYSIIHVEDEELKLKLSILAGNQSYVAENGAFLVFCADFYRHKLIGQLENTEVTASLSSTEKFMVALIDASLAAQNAAVAAESLGLGICYIGGIRSEVEKVSHLLQLPEYVIPLFGLSIGYPDQKTNVKPRLDKKAVLFKNHYPKNDISIFEGLKEFNETTSHYYSTRSSSARVDYWTGQMASMLAIPKRMHMLPFVQNKGFLKN